MKQNIIQSIIRRGLSFVLLSLLMPLGVGAQTNYNLWIGDTQVTSDNAGNVLGDGKVSFTVSGGQEAAPTYTLTLNGAELTEPVKVGLSNLTFDVRGNNTITVAEACIQNVAESFVPSLTFKSTANDVGSLTLTDTDENSTNGVISNSFYDHFTINKELALVMLRYGNYTSNTYYFTAGEVHNAQFVPSYGVTVEEMQVYAGNAADVFGDGKVSFDKETATLTLNNVSRISTISTTLSTLNIELVGSNSLYRSSNGSIFESLSGEAVTINLKSTGSIKGALTIETPENYGATIKGDNVTLTPVDPIALLSSNVENNKGTLVYGVSYGITINSADDSHPITSINRLDVVGDKGSVQFDGKNTLILNGAELSSVLIGDEGNWVQEGLTIYLKGENRVFTENEDALLFEGSDANMPLTFTTSDVKPGTLALSCSDQPLAGFTPTYLNSLISTYDDHTLLIAPGLDPVVDHTGEVANLDGDPNGSGHGEGLGTVLEGQTSATQVITADKKMLLTLGENDGFFSWTPSTTGDDAKLWDGGENAKLVLLSTEQNEIPANVEPGTLAFQTACKAVTMAVPAGRYEVSCEYKNLGNGRLTLQVGQGTDAPRHVFDQKATPGKASIVFATQRPRHIFLYNSAPSPSSRFRAPGRKMANTTTLKSVKVSARSVAATPPPVLMPKVLTKDDVAAAKSGNHITITDADVTDYADDAFKGLTGITYVDLSATSITGKKFDRDELKLPAYTTVFLPASNDDNLEKNIVIAGVCNDLQLNDDVDFEIPSDFTAVKASLSRNFSSDLGKNCTVCVPFALDDTQAAELGTFYTLSAHSENTITMESVDATEANKAYMFKPAKETFSAEMVDVKKADPVRTTVSPLSFLGTYQKIPALNSTAGFVYYCFMQDGPQAGKFVKITSDVIVNPFRAYMELPASASLARVLDLDFGEGGATGIGSLTPNPSSMGEGNVGFYDLQGRRVLYPKKGLYILNGKKVIIK